MRCGMALAVGVLAVGLVGPAGAQENLDQGKTPAQLFASDCAVCHKSPQGLAAKIGSGLTEFLREHYTASKESAAAIAGFLRQAGGAPAPGPKASKRKGDDKTKTGEKPGDKTGDNAEDKPADKKKAEPIENKPADKPKSAKTESKPSEPKGNAAGAQAEGGKSGAPKAAAPKRSDGGRD